MTRQEEYIAALTQAVKTIAMAQSVQSLHLVILYKDGKEKRDELSVHTAYAVEDHATGTLAEVLRESFVFFDSCWEETCAIN